MRTNEKLIKIGTDYVRPGSINSIQCGVGITNQKPFVTVDFVSGNRTGSIQVFCESFGERDALAESIANQGNRVGRWSWLPWMKPCTT